MIDSINAKIHLLQKIEPTQESWFHKVGFILLNATFINLRYRSNIGAMHAGVEKTYKKVSQI